ncbi:hypothetical protein Tco_1336774 [Tanacetum coccineum]
MADNRTMVSIAQEKRHPPGTPAAWVDFLDKMPRECLKNIESKSKVRQNTKQGSPLPNIRKNPSPALRSYCLLISSPILNSIWEKVTSTSYEEANAFHAQDDDTTSPEKFQLNELNELRDHAYENSLIYKEKTKRIHDSKIKNRVFNVGDRVLLFNSRLKIFSGKLKSRWSGPFTITQVFPYGTVELSQANGPNFKVNGHRIARIVKFSRNLGFVYSITRASNPQLQFGNPDILF